MLMAFHPPCAHPSVPFGGLDLLYRGLNGGDGKKYWKRRRRMGSRPLYTNLTWPWVTEKSALTWEQNNSGS